MEQSITTYRAAPRQPNTPREVIGILFRHRRLLAVSFLATFAGAAIATLLFGVKYKARTEFLIRQQRPDTVVSADGNSPAQGHDDQARAREINTEVELINSNDLLEQVVKATQLDQAESHFWNKWIPTERGQEAATAKAVRKLKNQLAINPVPDSNVIEVTYTSRDPEQAAKVLQELDQQYIAKHVAVNRPPGVVDFFQQQTETYQGQLADAESKLASFDLEQNAAAPDLERDILLRKANEFDGQLKEDQAVISSTQKRIHALNGLLSSTPDRLSTQQTVSDNAQLIANLKTSLADLEKNRTGLLEKYQPDYRPVKEIEKQIAQTKEAIAAAQQNPLRQETTDQNPTHELLQTELARSKADVAALHAKVAATAPIVQSYSKAALLLDQKDIKRQDLIRTVKTAEQNYLLYLNKREQARINDALDSQRILNVAVSEAATVPALPVVSPLLFILAGGVLAVMISMGSAFTADYFDQSFRTPDEVIRYLDMPVLAAFPKNGHAPRFALPSGSVADLGGESSSGRGRKRLFSWNQQDGN
jgi:uncharacterized protein involved in exopolysaccharide biosynthesis